MDVTAWEDPDPGELWTPRSDTEWAHALQRYLGTANDGPLQRCVSVARSNGAKTMVVETRYLGYDYRSEYTAFYSRVFAAMPDSAHRLHFFDGVLTPDNLVELPSNVQYLGYVVVRPSTIGCVVRAVLVPPPDLLKAVRTSATVSVNFFGQRLHVEGAPFSQQDTQLGACAHAAAWMCHSTAAARGDVLDRPVADFATNADPSLLPARAVPTSGLTVAQLSDVFRRFSLPPMFYLVGQLPHTGLPWQAPPPTPDPTRPAGTWDTQIIPTACRHLNGGFPVLVGTGDHAFVLVGWLRDPQQSGVVLIRHDDQQGPYLRVSNPLSDVMVHPDLQTKRDYGPWHTMHVPMPDKAWLLPESAEGKGGVFLSAASVNYAPIVSKRSDVVIEDLQTLANRGNLSLRTYVIKSNDFKEGLLSRGMSPDAAANYRLARMPRHVVVVEAVDRRLRALGDPSVLGEVVFDATSPDGFPDILAARVHGILTVQHSDRQNRSQVLTSLTPVLSGGRGSP